MKKHNLDPAYGEDSAARTGLVLSMGEVPDPVPLAPDDIEMNGWPVDADGRGLTLLEMEHLRRSTTNEAAA